MSELAAKLTVTGDFSGLVVETERGTKTVTDFGDTVETVSKKTENASKSTDKLNKQYRNTDRIVDQIRASMDPMFLATKNLALAEDVLSDSLKAGRISLQEHDKLLGGVRKEYDQTANAVAQMNAELDPSNQKWMDGFSDFGQSTVSLINLAGIAVGVLSTYLVPAALDLFGFGDAAKKSQEQLEAMSAAVDNSRSAMLASRAPTEDLIGLYGQYAEAARIVLRDLAELKNSDAVDAINEDARVLGSSFDALKLPSRDKLTDLFKDELRPGLMVKLGFSISPTLPEDTRTIEKVVADLLKLENARGLEKQMAAAHSLAKSFREAAMANGDLNKEERNFLSLLDQTILKMQEFGRGDDASAKLILGNLEKQIEMRRTMQTYGEQSAEVAKLRVDAEVAITEEQLRGFEISDELRKKILETARAAAVLGNTKVSGGLADAANEAKRMADEIQRAVSGMSSMAAQGIASLRESELRLQHKDDPVALAGALAGEKFGDTSGFDPLLRTTMNQSRQAFIDDAIATEKNRQELLAWNKGNQKKSGGGGKSDNMRARLIAELEKEISKLAGTYEADMAAATRWRDQSLETLKPMSEGYALFAGDVETIYNERLAAAYKKDLERREDWRAGVQLGLSDLTDDMRTWASTTYDLTTTWSQGMEDAFVEMRKTGKLNISNLVDHTLDELARLAYQKSVQPAISGLFDLISGGLGATLGGGSGSILGNNAFYQSHTGSEIGKSSVRASYGGGNGLRSDERVTITKLGQRVFTPRQLENGAGIVEALAFASRQPAASAGGNVTVEINNYSGNEVETSQKPDGTISIDIMGQIERSMAGRMQSGRGPLAQATKQTFGLNRSYAGSR